MMLNIKYKNILIALFTAMETSLEVWVYGSRVNGDAHEGSDLDLVIRTHNLQKLPAPIFYKINQQIRNCNVPIVVELFDWARLPTGFHKNIIAKHEILFSN